MWDLREIDLIPSKGSDVFGDNIASARGIPSKMSSYKTLMHTYPITAPKRTPFNYFSFRMAQFANLFHGSIVYFEHPLACYILRLPFNTCEAYVDFSASFILPSAKSLYLSHLTMIEWHMAKF